MSPIRCFVGFVLCAAMLTAVPQASAQEGQEDLDQATELQLTAKSFDDLEKVIALAESALKKGLDEDNEKFARQLLASTYYQHGKLIAQSILERETPGASWQLLRQVALQSFEKAVKNNSELGEAYLMICALQTLPGGDEEKARKAAESAVKAYPDNPKKRSEALVWRARLGSEPEQQLKDFKEAVEADPENAQAWESWAAFHQDRGELEEAAEVYTQLAEQQGDNARVQLALAETLANLEKTDEALKRIDRALELDPESGDAYALRGRIRAAAEEYEKAVEDLSTALEHDPNNLAALLLRSEIHLIQDDFAQARKDVEAALQLRPGLILGILMRSRISAVEKNYLAAIRDMELLLQNDPKNAEWRLQLAMYHSLDSRPRTAIKIITSVVDNDPENVDALRARGDALLSIGEHAEAVKDYNKALELSPEHTGILNNLAWVLSTSPEDEVRDGERAIELATKASELTEYKRPHILSTLASAYAETGDFETAKKWSSKAVELAKEESDEGDLDEQLSKELESYEKGEKWREKQETKERPLPDQRNLLET